MWNRAISLNFPGPRGGDKIAEDGPEACNQSLSGIDESR